MPNNNVVITDTSVLIAFEKLNLLNLVCLVYDELYLTKAVYNEYSNQLEKCFILKEALVSKNLACIILSKACH